MSDSEEVKSNLKAIEDGESNSSDEMLPLVYEELRRLASKQLRNESNNLTLQTTALVHEAYVRLVDADHPPKWDSRGHFFAAAAESMRRILIDRARQRKSLKGGGKHQRIEFDLGELNGYIKDDQLLALDDALKLLEEQDERKAALVKLRFFAGLTMPQAAAAIDISISTAERDWNYAKAWLLRQIKKDAE